MTKQHGGKRAGAGRKKSKWGESIRVCVPLKFWERVKQFIEEMKHESGN